MESRYDLVEALRRNPLTIMTGDNITAEAADEIERLRGEVEYHKSKTELAIRAGKLALKTGGNWHDQ